jgi:hypothetical protein
LYLIPLKSLYLFHNLSKCFLLFYSCISSLLQLLFLRYSMVLEVLTEQLVLKTQCSRIWRHVVLQIGGTQWHTWLRHCPTIRKVAGSIPHGAAQISRWLNPSCRTVVLESIQPLTEMSIKNISWGIKAAGA